MNKNALGARKVVRKVATFLMKELADGRPGTPAELDYHRSLAAAASGMLIGMRYPDILSDVAGKHVDCNAVNAVDEGEDRCYEAGLEAMQEFATKLIEKMKDEA